MDRESLDDRDHWIVNHKLHQPAWQGQI